MVLKNAWIVKCVWWEWFLSFSTAVLLTSSWTVIYITGGRKYSIYMSSTGARLLVHFILKKRTDANTIDTNIYFVIWNLCCFPAFRHKDGKSIYTYTSQKKKKNMTQVGSVDQSGTITPNSIQIQQKTTRGRSQPPSPASENVGTSHNVVCSIRCPCLVVNPSRHTHTHTRVFLLQLLHISRGFFTSY